MFMQTGRLSDDQSSSTSEPSGQRKISKSKACSTKRRIINDIRKLKAAGYGDMLGDVNLEKSTDYNSQGPPQSQSRPKLSRKSLEELEKLHSHVKSQSHAVAPSNSLSIVPEEASIDDSSPLPDPDLDDSKSSVADGGSFPDSGGGIYASSNSNSVETRISSAISSFLESESFTPSDSSFVYRAYQTKDAIALPDSFNMGIRLANAKMQCISNLHFKRLNNVADDNLMTTLDEIADTFDPHLTIFAFSFIETDFLEQLPSDRWNEIAQSLCNADAQLCALGFHFRLHQIVQKSISNMRYPVLARYTTLTPIATTEALGAVIDGIMDLLELQFIHVEKVESTNLMYGEVHEEYQNRIAILRKAYTLEKTLRTELGSEEPISLPDDLRNVSNLDSPDFVKANKRTIRMLERAVAKAIAIVKAKHGRWHSLWKYFKTEFGLDLKFETALTINWTNAMQMSLDIIRRRVHHANRFGRFKWHKGRIFDLMLDTLPLSLVNETTPDRRDYWNLRRYVHETSKSRAGKR